MNLRTSFGLALLVLLASPAPAATVTESIIRVDVQSSLGSGSFRVDPMGWSFGDDGALNWQLSAEQEITDGSQVLATFDSATVTYESNPVVALNFNVTSGAADTTFTITSGLLSFAPISSPVATASAGISISDTDSDGAARTGGFASATSSYRAHYNGAIPGGILFAELVDNSSVGTFGTQTSNDSTGPFVSIPGSLSSMQSQFQFTLSANDSAAGTSVFAVVPEPSTAVSLTALAAAAAASVTLRRNRTRI